MSAGSTDSSADLPEAFTVTRDSLQRLAEHFDLAISVVESFETGRRLVNESRQA